MTPVLILGIAVGAAGAWTVQSLRYDAVIADMRLEQARTLIAAQEINIKALEKAHEQTAKYQQAAHQAAHDAAGRVAAADAVAARNRTELERLRDAISTRPDIIACTVPDAATASTPQPADTIGELFGECGEALTELARAAQGHAIDVVNHQKAWPK